METIVTVWPDASVWIVSRDRVEDDYTDGQNTGAIRTDTLSVFTEREEAVQFARKYAWQHGLPCYEQDTGGVPTSIALVEPW